MAWIVRRRRKDGETSYRVCWRDPGGAVHSETYRRSDDAKRRLREVEHSKDAGTYRDPSLGKVRLDDFWEYFMRTTPPPAASTRSLYAMQARRYILPRLGHYRLNVITTPVVKEFLARLRTDGVGEPSVASTSRLLRRVLNVAVQEGRIPSNPAAGGHQARGESREMLFLSPRDVEALRSFVHPRYQALVHFLAYTGARIGEAAALRVKHLDLVRRRVRIEQSSSEVDGKLVTGPTKTKQKRTVAMPQFLVDDVAAHLDAFSDPSYPEALVFTSPKGCQLRQRAFLRVVKSAAAKAGLPTGLRTHDLRHTAVAFAIEAGWHPKKIQEMLGHSTIQVTFDTYGHLLDSLHEDGASRLDALYEAALDPRGGKVRTLRVVGGPAETP